MSRQGGKKKWIMIAVAVVVIAALGLGLMAMGDAGSKKKNPGGTVEYITKRTIANSITGNGTVEAASSEDVTGGSYGMKVKNVYVEVGDVVNVGDIICKLDTENIEEQIENVQKQISEAKQNKKEQLADYDDQIADRETSRKESLEEVKADLAKAEEDLKTENDELAVLKAELEAARAEVPVDYAKVDSLASDVRDQESRVDRLESRIDSYKSQIDSLEEQNTTSLETARDNYKEQMDNTIENYERQLKNLKEQRDDATIVAGISGVVTAVYVTEGGNISGGAIACIEGVDTFVIEAQIEEYDIPDIAVGMKVLIKTDATRDQELEGVVTYVAPRATNSGSGAGGLSGLMGGMDTSGFSATGGNATYLVKITLKENNSRLRLGMNAKTSIITEERVDVWSVPYDAVYTRTDGTCYVERVTGLTDEDGNMILEEMNVTLGLQGTYYVEVISDQITDQTQIFVPNAQGNSSIQELLNMMGADAGI